MDNFYTPEILVPRSINDFVNALSRRPDAQFVAGGTIIMAQSKGKFFNLPRSIIMINNIAELKKITRDERYLEIGSAVPINDILDLGKSVLPDVLRYACEAVAPPHIKNMATLGGNIGYRHKILDIFPALYALDAQVEILKVEIQSKRKHFFWQPVSRLLKEDGSFSIEPNELITRIRVAYDNYHIQSYQKFGTPFHYNTTKFIFCAVAELNKELIVNIRLIFSDGNRLFLRSNELEANFIGYRFPLFGRDYESLSDIFENFIEEKGKILDNFFIYQAKMLTLNFLSGNTITEAASNNFFIDL